jgi:hypothetical protein
MLGRTGGVGKSTVALGTLPGHLYAHTSAGGIELGDEGYPGTQRRWRGGGGRQGHANPIAAAKLCIMSN